MAQAPSSKNSVVAALFGNGFVTVIKFIAFALSGSGAMLSEAIHSAADTANQAVLYLGLKRSSRTSDSDFHYGYGSERFVFGLLSASGIFFVGCGLTLYHGVHSLMHPSPPEIGPVTFAVLGLSFLIEGSVLLYAFRAMLKKRGSSSTWRYLREKADPAELAILLEDSAAVLGLVLAAAGIGLAYVTGSAFWDSLASLIVGLLLGAIAVFLVIENRALLLGVAIPEEAEQRFRELLAAWPSIETVHDIKTRQLTPETYLIKAEIKLRPEHVAERLDRILPAERISLDAAAGRAEALHLVSKAAIDVIGTEIDAIEAAVRAAIPEAKHIDLELEHLRLPPDS